MLQVEVRVKRRIDERWSEWLDNLTISHPDQDETVLTGCIVDQAALYGLMAKLRDMGLPLWSVRCAEPGEPQATGSDQSGGR
jgi:hypothetical protein